MGIFTFTASDRTPDEFEFIGLSTEIRTDPNDPEVEQFRSVLRVVWVRRLENLLSIGDPTHQLLTIDSLTGSVNGGDTFTISPGLGFGGNFTLVNQEIVPIELQGSKFAQFRAEWTAVGDYGPITW